MGNVLIHSTITLDGFMADPEGGIDWMFGFITEICEGYDIERTVIDFKEGKPLSEKGSGILAIAAANASMPKKRILLSKAYLAP